MKSEAWKTTDFFRHALKLTNGSWKTTDFFFVPSPTTEGAPPKTCTHKCEKCGMRYQHEAGIECAKAKHKACNKK